MLRSLQCGTRFGKTCCSALLVMKWAATALGSPSNSWTPRHASSIGISCLQDTFITCAGLLLDLVNAVQGAADVAALETGVGEIRGMINVIHKGRFRI